MKPLPNLLCGLLLAAAPRILVAQSPWHLGAGLGYSRTSVTATGAPAAADARAESFPARAASLSPALCVTYAPATERRVDYAVEGGLLLVSDAVLADVGDQFARATAHDLRAYVSPTAGVRVENFRLGLGAFAELGLADWISEAPEGAVPLDAAERAALRTQRFNAGPVAAASLALGRVTFDLNVRLRAREFYRVPLRVDYSDGSVADATSRSFTALLGARLAL